MDEFGNALHCCGSEHLKESLRERLNFWVMDREDRVDWPFPSVSFYRQALLDGKMTSIANKLYFQDGNGYTNVLTLEEHDRTFFMLTTGDKEAPKLLGTLQPGAPSFPHYESDVPKMPLPFAKSKQWLESDEAQAVIDDSLVPVWAVGPLRTGPRKGPEVLSIQIDPLEAEVTFEDYQNPTLEEIGSHNFPRLKRLVIHSVVILEKELTSMLDRHLPTLETLELSD